ncbi:MAG: alpha/beta hydrolase family protein [Verrucomicrobiales bacterium]
MNTIKTLLALSLFTALPLSAEKENSLESRRAEIRSWFHDHVYGWPPAGITTTLTWSEPAPSSPAVLSETGTLTFTGKDGQKQEAQIKLYRPAKAEGPLPAVIFICNRSVTEMDFNTENQFWPMSQITERGWLTVAFNVKDVSHDRASEFAKDPGIIKLDNNPAGPHQGAALSAWAFTANEIREHLIKRKDVDPKRIGVAGHSRGGKAALLTGVNYPGFAHTYSNNSGCGGSAQFRTTRGEKIADITKGFPNWFCTRFQDYRGKEDQLRYDQHHLLGLIAPRHVHVASASKDDWADPHAEYLTCQLASPLHQFQGVEGLKEETKALPEPGHARIGGSISYHLREGKHDLTPEDWHHFLSAAEARW